MKMHRFVTLGCCGLTVALLVLSGCAHLGTGAARNGIVLFADHGKNRPVTQEEIDALSGVNLPYCVQVGDVLDVAFKIRAARTGEARQRPPAPRPGPGRPPRPRSSSAPAN